MNVAAAQDVLVKMGVTQSDMTFALAATDRLARRYGPGRHEQAAEFIGSAMAVTGATDMAILLLPNLMDYAERLSG